VDDQRASRQHRLPDDDYRRFDRPDSGTTVPMGINLSAAKALSFARSSDPARRIPQSRRLRQHRGAGAVTDRRIVPEFLSTAAGVRAVLGATWSDTTTENDRAAGSLIVKSCESRACARRAIARGA